MNGKNEDLTYATLDYIREHPKEWDQSSYVCGSTACFAGRACLIAGVRDEKGDIWREPARKALGWTRSEAAHVFYLQTKDFAVLERAVKEVLNGEVTDYYGEDD